jgi:hypothetical protein
MRNKHKIIFKKNKFSKLNIEKSGNYFSIKYFMARQTDPERLGHHLELFQTTFHEFF